MLLDFVFLKIAYLSLLKWNFKFWATLTWKLVVLQQKDGLLLENVVVRRIGFFPFIKLIQTPSAIHLFCRINNTSILYAVIFSRILYLVSSHPPTRPSVQISSRATKMAKAYSEEPGNDFDMKARNLSSTLEKIYAWEKKLYKEVKVWKHQKQHLIFMFVSCG